MTKANSTAPTRSRKPKKPEKPQKDFPLFAHAVGQWAKKIRGRMHYFGVWADPQAALKKWLTEKDALLAGRTPRAQSDGLTVRELANRYMTHKQNAVNSGEIAERTWMEYYATCEKIVDAFGPDRLVLDLASDDFERLRASIAAMWGPVRLGNEVQRIRGVFKFAFDSDLIASPVRYGPAFKRPSRKVLRKQRAEKGPRLFEAKEIRDLIKIAGQQLKAMIWLGVNCGFGNEDCATLPVGALDLSGEWVRFPRPKTGVDRKCKLWPETVKALRAVLADRRKPDDNAYCDRVFITKYGKPWSNETYGTAITHEMGKLLGELKIKRLGLSFYGLRHVFETIGGGSRDQVAVDHIMGHARNDMGSHYRERIEDERLEAVAEHVRTWLFAKPAKARKAKSKG